jgi:hypothetical protein
MTVKPTPEELMGYADGQLDAEHSKRVEHALAAHPELRATVEDHRRTRAAAREALDAMAAEPMSPGLAKLAETLKAPGGAVSRSRALTDFAWPAAAAACLAVGLAAGAMVGGNDGGLIRWQDGPSAGPQLVRVLETSPSGEGGRIIVVASFEAADGRYCRQFEIEAADGLACRGDEGWDILAFARRPGGAGSYQAASGGDPVAIAVTGLSPGPRIEGEAERALIGKGWKD